MKNTMKIEILTLFPEIFEGFLNCSLLSKAISKKILKVSTINIRDFAEQPHYHVDDAPYGGGAGMVMKPEPLAAAIEASKARLKSAPVVLLGPGGVPFSQDKAREYSELPELILICGRYEGIDQRVIDLLVDQVISIGDYVLMGGEVPAMTVIEASVRLVEGVIGNPESLKYESFAKSRSVGAILEPPQYTRPPEFRGAVVPEILLSGNHAKIESWREKISIRITREKRPDLLSETKPNHS